MPDDQSVLDDLEKSLNDIPIEDWGQQDIQEQVLLLSRAAVGAHQLYRRQIAQAIDAELDYKNSRRQRIVRKRDTYTQIGEKPPSEKILLAYVDDDENLKKQEREAELSAGLRDATLEEIRTLRGLTNAYQSLLADLRALVGAA